MGLKEKLSIKAFQENKYGQLVNEISAIAGFEPGWDIDWNSLAVEGQGSLYNEGFTKIYFQPVKKAFSKIVKSELGKESLKASLQTIVIRNQNDNYSPQSAYSFENGILTIDHSPVTNIDEVDDRTDYLTEMLYSKL